MGRRKVVVIDEVHVMQRGEPLKPMAMNLLPPAPGVCQVCAVEHGAEEAHDWTSIYYQVRFRAENGRDPTFEDAVAHLSPELQEQWRTCFAATKAERGLK